MNTFNHLIKYTMSVVVVCCTLNAWTQIQDDYIPNQVIFKLKEEFRSQSSQEGLNLDGFSELISTVGITQVHKVFPNKNKEYNPDFIDLSLIYELKYTGNYSVFDVISSLKNLKLVEYAEPHYLPKLCYTPSDTSLPIQWYIPIINAENAWTTHKGDTNIVIGITDTGWDPTHPDLVGSVKKNYADPINGSDDDADGYTDNYLGWDLANDDNNALWESTGHGVNVTGIAAATTDNVTGIAGVGFNTMFLPVKISNGAGQLTHAYQGVVYAADHGCDIINCSWGGYTPSQFNQDVINYAVINKGCLVIGAVGNDNGENVFYPAGYEGVLSVGATEQSDLKKNNSNHGYYVDVSAPGEAMWTTGPNGGYGYNGGTSMAAPVVAGAAAIFKTQFPFYTNQQIGALIQATADDLNVLNPSYIDKLGSGRVNLFNGISATNPQFMELTNHNATDLNNNIFVNGDTIYIEGFFTNHLDPLSNVTINITSSSPYVSILDGNTSIVSIGSQVTLSNNADKFIVQVLGGAPLNEPVVFKAVISDGSYVNNEYFTVVLNTDYINLEENLVATTITSRGKIGHNDTNNAVGLGFTYNGEQLLFEAGLMIGDGASRVADVVRDGSSQNQDFSSIQNVQYAPPFKASKDLYGVIDDSPLTSPLDIQVEQYSYAYANAPDDKYVIVYYRIENTGLSTLNNVFVGIFADWDIDSPLQNKAAYDPTRKMGYVYSLANDSTFAGIKVLSSDPGNNYSLDLDGSGGVDANGGGFITSEKYTTLSTSRSTAGGVTGKDVAHVVSTGGFSINPGQNVVAAFAIIAGDSLTDLQASADAAQIRFDNDNLSIGNINRAENISIFPNPTNGRVYINAGSEIKSIELRNALGQLLASYDRSSFDISGYADGIYFVEVLTEENRYVKKLVLRR
jgi:subtilisin family serine protease